MVEIPNLDQGSLEALSKERNLPFNVRLATAGDIDILVLLINTAYLYENEGDQAFKNRDALRVDKDTIRAVFEEGALIIASGIETGEERILGCVHYKEIPPSEGSSSEQETNAYFGMLAVDKNLQGQRIGTHLVGVAETIAGFRGRNLLEIQVVDRSAHLLDWYGRLGYEEFGRRDWDASFLTKPCQFVLMKKRISFVATN